jgi:hemoglobin
VKTRARLLDALGGESGCKQLSAAFYARVHNDPVLRPLFPGKSVKCAIEEFSAFLVQFLGGDEDLTQRRWWLSLRESHARFRIGPGERSAWLTQMAATLEASALDEATRTALLQFFESSSSYLLGDDSGEVAHEELAPRWIEQRMLDRAIDAIASGRDEEAMDLAARFSGRGAVFVGLLARMVRSGRTELAGFVVTAVSRDRSLAFRRFAGRALLHVASGAGGLEVVRVLLGLGAYVDVLDGGGHTPLYSVANECSSDAGPELVRLLVQAGADVNACGGVTRATPLHMAARRGHVEIARVLLALGAATEARDSKGVTPLERAANCRKTAVVALLRDASI